MKDKTIVNGMILMTALLWGSSYSVRKMGLEFMGPFFFNWLRFFAAFLFVISIYFIKSTGCKKLNITKDCSYKDIPLLYQIKGGIFAGITYGIGSAFQQWGLMSTVTAKVGFITSLYTLFVPLISWFILKKTVKKQVWIGSVFAFAGLALISFDGRFGISIGDVAIFISAIIFAIQIIIVGNFSKRSNPLIMVSAQMLTASFISMTLSLLFETGNSISGAEAGLLPIIYSGVFSLGVANILQSHAQKTSTPSITAIILSFESVFGALFGIILLQEYMNIYQTVGCLLIFTAIIVSQYERKKTKESDLQNGV